MNTLTPIIIDPETFLYENCTLPSLPAILTQIQAIVNTDEVTFEKITNLIHKDPALTAQVLRIVNSAYYSLPLEVTKLKVAVAYLGIEEIHRMVFSVSIINSLASEEIELFNEIWYHSLFTALCAKSLAKKFEPLLNSFEIWTVALLHDIGKLVYLKFFPDHYKELRQYTENNGCLFSEAEKEFSSPSSAYLGTLLCDRWRLPQIIKDSCKHHSLLDLRFFTGNNSIANTIIRIVALANLIAIVTTDELRQEKREEIMVAIREALDVTEANLILLISEMA